MWFAASAWRLAMRPSGKPKMKKRAHASRRLWPRVSLPFWTPLTPGIAGGPFFPASAMCGWMGSIRPIKPAPAISERITAGSAYFVVAAHFRCATSSREPGGMENREIGEVLVVAGALLFLAGFVFFPICGVGLVLIILGL